MIYSRVMGVMLLFLFLVPCTLAIGIQPAKTTIIAAETPHYIGQFLLVNNEGKRMTVKLYPEGIMTKYITLTPSEVELRSDDLVVPVEIKVDLPAVVPPGITNHYIVIEQEVGNAAGAPDLISSQLILRHKVILQGEYPDKYVEVNLNFHDQGNEIRMVSEVENLGKQDLQEVKTTFFVNGQEGQPLALETEAASLPTHETKLLESRINRSFFSQGEYTVSAVTTYDDLEVELVKQLQIGKPEVEVTYFTPFFIAHQVNEYTLDLLNKWNREIKNIYVDVEVKKGEQKVDEFRTQSVDLPAQVSKRIKDYLDARNTAPGIYTFDFVVNFWDNYRMASQRFSSEFLPPEDAQKAEFFVQPPPLAGKAEEAGVSSPKGSSGRVVWGVILLVVFGFIAGFVLWRYRHRDEYE